ncbi:MAG TPA: DNA-3-methyladenine glycosylase [Gemmatimonadaceae bacterium]|nr:DNA-3-methyladenine glycosylase [Gemmatimonadaceae bacterium]
MTRDAAPRARRSRLGAPLPVAFYDRDTEIVSRELLGAVLECTTAEGVTRGRIVETEAYLGPDDPACHAAAGLTSRTEHLFGPPAMSYVYLIYGMYWCFNAVTRERGHGSAVLVRAVEPIDGIELMRRRRPKVKRDRDLTNGPGKLCLAMGIDGTMSGLSLRTGPLVIRAGEPVPDADVDVTPRIGITRAAEWPLRYLVRASEFVSATPAAFRRTPYQR